MLDSFAMQNLFGDSLRESLVLHIPHSSSLIPSYSGIIDFNLLHCEIALQTDWATKDIFNIPETTKIISEFSRLFCDVERFLDDNLEPMSKIGRGFLNTHSACGKQYREITPVLLKLATGLYNLHHAELTCSVQEKIKKFGGAMIIDCHSFSDNPLPFENSDKPRADICIGTDKFHTPDWLVNYLKVKFIDAGYSVDINYPYEGSIVPMKFYNSNENVFSVMIEINKRLYMDGFIVNDLKVKILNNIITDIFTYYY